MQLFLFILLILMPVSAMAKQTLATTDITDERHLLELLDSYIEKRDVYAKQKEEKLKQLKLRLRTADDNAARLAILNTSIANTIRIVTTRLWSTLTMDWLSHGATMTLTTPRSTSSIVLPCCRRADSTASRNLF